MNGRNGDPASSRRRKKATNHEPRSAPVTYFSSVFPDFFLFSPALGRGEKQAGEYDAGLFYELPSSETGGHFS